MVDFILNKYNSILKSSQDVVALLNASMQSSIDDNITYLEASIDTYLSRFFEDSIEGLLAALKKLKEQYKDKITFRPDIGLNKSLDKKTAHTYAEACLSSNLFNGIDSYGIEFGQDLEHFKPIYHLAKMQNLKTKIHIGEFSDAQSIKEAILMLNPSEIQHGITAIHSDYVMDMIRERDIQLNICPESNLKLGAVKDLKTHPIRKLFDKGIRVTINTDDLVLFNKSVSDQFDDLLNENVFSFEELEIIRKNGFD
jgi:adenosine deaminase